MSWWKKKQTLWWGVLWKTTVVLSCLLKKLEQTLFASPSLRAPDCRCFSFDPNFYRASSSFLTFVGLKLTCIAAALSVLCDSFFASSLFHRFLALVQTTLCCASPACGIFSICTWTIDPRLRMLCLRSRRSSCSQRISLGWKRSVCKRENKMKRR